MPATQTETGQLQGLKVLVTRPARQADSLCQLLAGHGASVLRFPLLEIHEAEDPAWLDFCLAHLQDYDWAIFISVNAVQHALPAILARRDWPAATRIAAIGKSSAAALQSLGLKVDACPRDQYDSEALLKLKEMQQVAGLQLVIFRGNGGRETLANTLRTRQARVDYVECYQRVNPDAGSLNADDFGKLTRADLILINSTQSLANLSGLFSGRNTKKLYKQQLLVVSPRLVDEVEQAGFEKKPLVADNATDQAVLETILVWQRQREI